MKKALIAAAAFSLVLAISAFAADGGQPSNAPGQNFDKKKTDILKMLDMRIAGLQEAKNCIQATQNHDDIKACWEKHRAEMKEMREEMKQQRGMGAPGGPMGR